MFLEKLNIHDFRLFESQSINLNSNINVFYGENGSGKTSILEAINFVLNGRSFRTSNTKHLIRNDQQSATVFVQASSVDETERFRIGVTKKPKETELLLNGQKQTAFSAVAILAPLQIVDPSSFNLLESPPDFRRRFVDWSVFHVEHLFLEHWKRYKNSLKQRNTLLRRGKISDGELSAWNQSLIIHGEFINQSRKEQLLELQPILISYLKQFLPNVNSVDIRYMQGWDKNESLSESLMKNMPGDLDQGYTRFGPHRADIKFLVDGKTASEYLSRGQQKSFHICLKLAQSELVLSKTQKQSIFLLDDITAELDKENIQRVYECLAGLKAQVFVTTLDILKQSQLNHLHSKSMFHVEHGEITQVAE